MMTGFAQLFLAQQAPPLQPLPHPQLPDPALVQLGTPWWVYGAAAGLVLILLGLVLWLLMRPAKARPTPMKKPYSAAMKRLQAVLMQSAQQPPAQTAADVSDTLRIYFLERYNIPAPMRTTQELFEKGGIPATSLRLQKYATLAELWDQLAFAPLPANHAEATALVQKAIASLEEDRA
jgi:hypothetical protein